MDEAKEMAKEIVRKGANANNIDHKREIRKNLMVSIQ